MNAIRLYGGTSMDRARALESVPAAVQAKGVMDTIYPWWMDEREFPRRAVITEWFYNPLKGQPRYVDIYRLRALAASEWVWMCTSTIIEELAQIPWEIEPKDPKLKEDPPERLLAIIDEIKYFLNNPNDNKGETLNTILRACLRDGLEIDATCMIKGFTANSYMQHPAGGFELKPPGERQLVELFARDGGSFLKETDVNGIEYRYWQYSYLHPAVAPIEFDTNEIVYAARYPRSYSVYGWGELQSMETVLNCLINSAFTNATMFQEWAVPSGVLSFSGTKEDEDRMREYWRTEVKGRFHKVAMLNRDAKFVPLAYTNRDLEFLEGQQWFAKLVWALYKLTPTELGFQDEIRQTGKAMNAQGQIQKRKSVMPLLHLVEQFMTQQIISEFSDELQFVFNFVDKQEELAETEIALEKIKEGLITTNEWRKKSKSGDPRPWGDEPMQIILARMKAAAGPLGVGSNPTGPGQAALSDMTAEQHGLMEGAKAWGGRPFQSFDFEDRADRASPVYSYDDKSGKIVQQADTTMHPEAYGKDFVPTRRGPYAGRGKPIPYPMGAMGQRPDEPGPRDGMLLGGENPEEINKTRAQMAEEYARSSGQGAHRWERDETNAGIAMGKIIDPLDRLAPPRRVTDPITDPESRIIPTPLVRPEGEHPKGKRDVPPVAGATGPKKKKPQKILGLMGMSRPETPATGPQHQETLGALERPEHGHSDVFHRGMMEERGLHRKQTYLLKAYISGTITKEQALTLGMKAIDANIAACLEIARKHAARAMKKEILELPPELVSRYEGFRAQSFADFQRILEDGTKNLSVKMTVPIPSKAGGKRREASFLKTLIPPHTLYVEPFAGGAALFYMLDQPGKSVLNDINPRFTKVWKWIKEATPEQVKAMIARPWTATRQSWLNAKRAFRPKSLDDEVWQHLYVTRHSFMNRGDTWKGNVSDPAARKNTPPTWLGRVGQYQKQLGSTRIESVDWKQIVRKYDAPGTFFYLDPPYEQKFVPNLLKLLPRLKGKWLLSFSDNKTLMDGLKKAGAQTFIVPVTNTINKPTGQKRTMRKELLAANYPIKIPRGLVFKGVHS